MPKNLTSGTKKEIEFWKEVMSKMISSVKDDTLRRRILNYRDEDGDTILHIIAKQEKVIDVIEYLIYSGADLTLTNNADETPLEISWRYSMSVYNLLQAFQSSEVDYFDRRTRTSLGLSETKDYTQFFEQEEEEEVELKRKVSNTNVSLIDKLEKLPTVNTASTLHCNRKRKRQDTRSELVSETQEEIEEISQENTLVRVLNEFGISISPSREKNEECLRQEIKETIQNIHEMYKDVTGDQGEFSSLVY